jgi:putative oxidoreductase
MELALPLLLGVLGLLFVGHSTQKLFGWFGGHDHGGTGQHFESLGLRPGRRQALAAGTAEMVGGSLLAAGALTPLAGTVMSVTMVTAVRRVLLEYGLWIGRGGYECALHHRGHGGDHRTRPGRASVDAALMPVDERAPGWRPPRSAPPSSRPTRWTA